MQSCVKPPAPSSREGIVVAELKAFISLSLVGFQGKKNTNFVVF